VSCVRWCATLVDGLSTLYIVLLIVSGGEQDMCVVVPIGKVGMCHAEVYYKAFPRERW
jgi:hypothetical protein